MSFDRESDGIGEVGEDALRAAILIATARDRAPLHRGTKSAAKRVRGRTLRLRDEHADQLIGRPVPRRIGWLSEGCVAYWAALRRAHACVYPSVRRGRLSLPSLEAPSPIGFPWALRRARPARIRSERRTDFLRGDPCGDGGQQVGGRVGAVEPGRLMADERDVALAQLADQPQQLLDALPAESRSTAQTTSTENSPRCASSSIRCSACRCSRRTTTSRSAFCCSVESLLAAGMSRGVWAGNRRA